MQAHASIPTPARDHNSWAGAWGTTLSPAILGIPRRTETKAKIGDHVSAYKLKRAS